ncbi:MAG: hypothetical protein HYT13_01865 [Candidatus Liptonbacteria bacterium]|nr:hypothetical protein [Candidatus Liptonbacteria bacterium]
MSVARLTPKLIAAVFVAIQPTFKEKAPIFGIGAYVTGTSRSFALSLGTTLTDISTYFHPT